MSALTRNICGGPPSRQQILWACTAWRRFDLLIFPHLIATPSSPPGVRSDPPSNIPPIAVPDLEFRS